MLACLIEADANRQRSIPGVEWKKQIDPAAASRPGSSFSAVARRYHIDLRLLFRWRQALGMGSAAKGGASCR
jgi:transposase-like protein